MESGNIRLSDSTMPALAKLFEALPLTRAMPSLLPSGPASPEVIRLAEQAAEALESRPDLLAGLWLYVDDLHRSHTISQSLDTRTGSLWHAIMHRREGDFENSKYWLRRALPHPALEGLEEYDPYRFVDHVAAGHLPNPELLVERQRREWAALFEWCAAQGEAPR